MELSGIKLLGEDVEGFGMLPKELNFEYSLGIGQVEAREVVVEARLGRSEVGDWRGQSLSAVQDVTQARRLRAQRTTGGRGDAGPSEDNNFFAATTLDVFGNGWQRPGRQALWRDRIVDNGRLILAHVAAGPAGDAGSGLLWIMAASSSTYGCDGEEGAGLQKGRREWRLRLLTVMAG